jgi:hypothetical protein
MKLEITTHGPCSQNTILVQYMYINANIFGCVNRVVTIGLKPTLKARSYMDNT